MACKEKEVLVSLNAKEIAMLDSLRGSQTRSNFIKLFIESLSKNPELMTTLSKQKV